MNITWYKITVPFANFKLFFTRLVKSKVSNQKCLNRYFVQTLLNKLCPLSYTICVQSHCKKNTLICIWIINTIYPCKHKMQYFPAEKMCWTFCRAVVCRLLRCSTCVLVLGCWGLNHLIFLKLRKKNLRAKLCKFTKWQLFSLKTTT